MKLPQIACIGELADDTKEHWRAKKRKFDGNEH
jgi:hypothetical protein